MAFPKDFVWGAATAAYQIEGAAFADGKGESVWDVYCRRKDAIWEGQSGEVACDHYNRYKEDVGIMKRIGLKAYRFGIAWPRVMPEGVGRVNEKGLDFYDRLVDELLKAGIDPWVTLFHWDYPQALFERGGWLSPESPDWFAEYTGVIVDRLGDRVRNWFTHNEIQCFIDFGHRDSLGAPGLKLSRGEVLRAGHNALLAHGKAVQVIRAHAKLKSRVGWAAVCWTKIPASGSPADIRAARKATLWCNGKELLENTWWMDPVYLGRYPEDGLEAFGADAPKVRPGDMETICQPLDFQGMNIYNGIRIQAGKDGSTGSPRGGPEVVPHPTGYPMNHFHGAVTPECLYWGPKFLYERYKLPIVMAENGTSIADCVSLDGKVHDPQRIDYTHRYLLQFERAAKDGVKIAGYFVWSLLDNFEWGHGYKQRFGMVHVDFNTLKRTIKDSAFWYGKVIKTNGRALHAK
jgi:beta-glucosidase